MIYNSDELNRRPLNFSAVKPGESISSLTLINSLITLCSKICKFKSQDFNFIFTTNKRNSDHAIRLIQILLVFLEEIRNDYSDLPKPVISSLSEIHFILQKIQFLLQDCTRHDARVWMLMKSGSVAHHFRVLIGSMATVLGRVEFDSIWVSDEVRDYIRVVVKQGDSKTGRLFDVEEEDAKVSELVVSILGQFERRVIPNPGDLKRVMDYLGIKKWSDCNKQVKFLEEQTGSDPDTDLDATGLMGFVMYCRCVIFDSTDGGESMDRRSNDKSQKSIVGCLNPDDFKCPITLEIMADPVTISSGHTYDRRSILKWFNSGNPVCPKTGQKLQNLDMVPNIALKELIKQYCLENGINIPSPKSLVEDQSTRKGCNLMSLAAEEAVKMAADFLSIKLAMGTLVEKSKAAYETRLLTKRSMFNRVCCMESGLILYLLKLLFCKDSAAQENSIAALLNLSKHPQCKPIIVKYGGLALIIGVLKSGIRLEARQHAAASLFYLSSIEEYRRSIGNNPDAIPSLVELIRVGGDRGKKNALVAIFGLLLVPSNSSRLLEAKLVPLLVSLMRSMENEDLIVDSLAVLSALAQKQEGAKAILRAGALHLIMGILCSSSYDSSRLLGREHCVSLLLALCINCRREVVEVLVKNPSLMGALYSLLTEGTPRASKKASSLINILHEFSETTSSRSVHYVSYFTT